MNFPPPPPSTQSSIASGTDKSSSRSARSQQSVWGSSASHPTARRGLTPLATSNLPFASASASARGPPHSSSPGPGPASGPGTTTSSPLTSTFSAVLSSSRGFPSGRNTSSPANSPSPFFPFHSGLQQYQHSGQSVSSPKLRSRTPSSGPHLTSTTGSIVGGGGSGGGGGTGSTRGVAFSPLSSGRTVNSPTGFPSEKSSSGAHASQSSLSKISVAQVFLLLDSITEKEGKEKWEAKAGQIHKVS